MKAILKKLRSSDKDVLLALHGMKPKYINTSTFEYYVKTLVVEHFIEEGERMYIYFINGLAVIK